MASSGVICDGVEPCCACLQPFDGAQRCPRVLSCGHMACAECLGKLVAGGAIKCPLCCRDTPVPDGVASLTVNLAVLAAQRAGESRSTAKVCELCEGEVAARVRCADCRQVRK